MFSVCSGEFCSASSAANLSALIHPETVSVDMNAQPFTSSSTFTVVSLTNVCTVSAFISGNIFNSQSSNNFWLVPIMLFCVSEFVVSVVVLVTALFATTFSCGIVSFETTFTTELIVFSTLSLVSWLVVAVLSKT